MFTFSAKVCPPFLYSVCGGRLPFSGLRLCVEKTSFVLIDVKYTLCTLIFQFTIWAIVFAFLALCVLIALLPVCLPTAPHWSLVCSTLNARINHSLCIANCHNLLFFFFHNLEKRHQNLHTTPGLLCAHSLQQAHCTSQGLTESGFCLQDGTGQVLQNSGTGTGWDELWDNFKVFQFPHFPHWHH